MLGLVPEAVLEEVSLEGSRAGAGPPRVAWEGCPSPDHLIWAASILCNRWHERRSGWWGRVPGQLSSGRGAGGAAFQASSPRVGGQEGSPFRGCCPSCVMLPDP